MPALWRAISVSVLPSTAVCSSETEVITAIALPQIALVASVRPPRPHSMTAYSHPSRKKYKNAAAVCLSNAVGLSSILSAAALTSPRYFSVSPAELLPFTLYCSSKLNTSGEVNVPVSNPAERRICVRYSHTEPLPLEPAT